MLRTVFLTSVLALAASLTFGQTVATTTGWTEQHPMFGVRAAVDVGASGKAAWTVAHAVAPMVGVDASFRRTWFTGASTTLDVWWGLATGDTRGLQASGLHATTRVGPIYLKAERSYERDIAVFLHGYSARPAGLFGTYDLLELRLRGRPELLTTVRFERFLGTHAVTVPLAAPRLWSRDTTALAATTLRLQPNGLSDVGFAWGVETSRRRGPSARGRQWLFVSETSSGRVAYPGFDAQLAFDAAEGRLMLQASSAGTPNAPKAGHLTLSFKRESTTATLRVLNDGSVRLQLEANLRLTDPGQRSW